MKDSNLMTYKEAKAALRKYGIIYRIVNGVAEVYEADTGDGIAKGFSSPQQAVRDILGA